MSKACLADTGQKGAALSWVKAGMIFALTRALACVDAGTVAGRATDKVRISPS